MYTAGFWAYFQLFMYGAAITIFVGFFFAAIFNRYMPKWFCDKMGWHLAPESQGFDGCSRNGECPRCGKSVMRDSQGNWF